MSPAPSVVPAGHRRRRCPWRLLTTLLAVATLATACSGDEESAAESNDDTTTTAAPTTTAPDEQPPGTEPEAVEPYIEDLLRQYDETVAAIVADPEIAANRDHELYADFRELLAPDSTMTEPLVNAIVHRAEQGISQLPYEEARLPVARAVDGDIDTVSPDEVTFPICTYLSYRLMNSAGQETEFHTDLAQPGQASAVRIHGEWRVSHLNRSDDAGECRETR